MILNNLILHDARSHILSVKIFYRDRFKWFIVIQPDRESFGGITSTNQIALTITLTLTLTLTLIGLFHHVTVPPKLSRSVSIVIAR